MKKINVSSKCNACGLCTVTDKYLQEDGSGKAQPIPGRLIKDDELDAVNKLIEDCPVNALSLTEVESNISKKAFIESAIKKLTGIPELAKPKQSDFPYKQSEFHVPYYGASGQYRYEYSSSSSANSAAQREFEKQAYSQIKTLALKLVVQYKSKYLAPYYVDDSASIFSKSNDTISKLLLEIAGEYESLFDKKLDAEFLKFDAMPDSSRNSLVDMLRKDTLFTDEIADIITSKLKSTNKASDYETYWDWDSEDKYIGKGMFGDKYKTMYCYKDVEKANKELANDIAYTAGMVDINLKALEKACAIVDDYNRNVKKSIEEKIAYLKKL